MDFSNLEIEQSGSTWVHLEISDKPLYLDGMSVTVDKTEKPCRVSVKSATDNAVYKAFKAYQNAEQAYQARLSRVKDKDIDALAAKHSERAEDLMDEVIVAAVDGFENIALDGKLAKPSRDAVLSMIDRNHSYSKRAIRGQLFAAITEKQDAFTDAAQG